MENEYRLLCDIKGCDAGIAMVSEVARELHGWGRCSVYSGMNGVRDFDLCPHHFRETMNVLEGWEYVSGPPF